MAKPNFFIVGAPKCGTTALAAYLADHPQVFFSQLKEPHYWAEEFPRARRHYNTDTMEKYLALFRDAQECETAIGEGSTRYLSSETAIARILEFQPDARFIVMLRNPVDMVYAMHNTLLYGMNEEVEDFEAAWRLQDRRLQGEAIPATCLEPSFLQYRDTARLGHQMQRFLAMVPGNQRHVIIFDDFRQDVGRVYRDTLSFLGLTDDARTEFPIVNPSKQARFRAIRRFLRRPPRIIARPVNSLRRYLSTVGTGPLAAMKRKLRVEKKRIPLRPEFVRELQESFRDEVRLLSELLDRDLMNWVDPGATMNMEEVREDADRAAFVR